MYKGIIPSWIAMIPATTVNIALYTTVRDYYIYKKKEYPTMNFIIMTSIISCSLGELAGYPFNLLRTKL